jgi:PhnB protein
MLAPYVTFNGNAEEAFNFYKTAFDGTLTNVQRFGDSPQGGEMSENDKNKIMHISLEAPHDIILMGNDHLAFMGEPFLAGNNFSLSLHPSTQELADHFFNNLSKEGTVTVPMSKAPWGDYFGMFTDKFGIKWMINQRDK